MSRTGSARRLVLVLWLALAAGTASVKAQVPPPATVSAAAIPHSPAGAALLTWLDVYNSGDSSRIRDYLLPHREDSKMAGAFSFRAMTGGVDLVTIERSAPLNIEFTVRERKSGTIDFGALDLSTSEPTSPINFLLQPLGPSGSVAGMHIDARTRARVVARSLALLDSFYVFPEVAKRVRSSVQANATRGHYDAYANGLTFAMRLSRDINDIAHDKHLNIRYSIPSIAPGSERAGTQAPSSADIAQMRLAMDAINCGFRKAERLEGNIGYLDFGMFADPQICGPTASAAMNFLAGSSALIIDLRANGGGTPAMVALLSSYLFDRPTHLNDLWTRRTGTTQEFWTRDSVPGRRFGGEKPVYLLTSAGTFSGAEEFAYDLKALKRATIVGEITGGGAHPVRGRPIDEHFVIDVPFARAINPITHTNWEGVGVEPDVRVPASEALLIAQRILREGMQPADTEKNPGQFIKR